MCQPYIESTTVLSDMLKNRHVKSQCQQNLFYSIKKFNKKTKKPGNLQTLFLALVSCPRFSPLFQLHHSD